MTVICIYIWLPCLQGTTSNYKGYVYPTPPSYLNSNSKNNDPSYDNTAYTNTKLDPSQV